VTCGAILAAPVAAQDTQPPVEQPEQAAEQDGVSSNEILVIGSRLRGEVIASQPPVAEYNERDIQALGAGSLTEVLEALGPQVGSGRGRGGGRPLILVNGRRISDFRELASYPPEAVRKVSILPEEVALQYGFPPDQRVVNFILKEDFASREVEAEFEQPDRGGFRRTELELTYLRINGPDRLNASLELRGSTGLTDAERGIALSAPVLDGDPDPAQFRSLVAPSTSAEATLSWSRGLGVEGAGGLIALNGSYNRSDRRNLEGLATVLLVGPTGERTFRSLPSALATETRSDTYALGATLDKPVGEWRFNGTVNATLGETETLTGNRPDTDPLVRNALAGTLSPRAPLPPLYLPPSDLARLRTKTIDNIATLSGRVLELPAGQVAATLDAQYKWNSIRSEDTRATGANELSRSRVSAGANFSIPVAERDGLLGAIGEVSLTLGGGIDHLSDFGTLWDANLVVTWKPTEKLTLQASYIPREAAPTLTQLGASTIVTPNVPIFDLVTGRTALVTLTTGGNLNLLAEQQRDLKLAVNWQLPEIDENIREGSFDLEYFRNRSTNVSAAFPFLTPAIEGAFPARVTRDADDNLLAIDQSPVTLARQNASRLRIALNLGGSFSQDDEGLDGRRGGAGAGARGGDPGAMLRRGPPSGGRWRLTLDYTRELENTVLVSPQGPELDLLNGDALVAGGTPANRIGARFFGFYKGFGGRAEFDWFSATQVRGTGIPGGTDLNFGSLAKLNLRLFTDLERVFPKTAELKGARLSFVIDNVFDGRQRVTDDAGQTPRRYQPFLIDPVGRYLGVEVRKLFL
jgi:hypothetical protein